METKELKVVIKSQDLIEHTFLLTNNQSRFPKKIRYTLVQRLQDKSMNIYETLIAANACDTNYASGRQKRRELQIQVITDCKSMLFFVEYSMKQHYITPESCAYWSKLICDVKNMTGAWIKSESKKA